MPGKISFSIYMLLLPALAFSQLHLKGNAEIDSTWHQEIYISEIASLHDLYKCSNAMIVGKADIDSLGNWQLELPGRQESRLFRLHVRKKEYPIASLIIGGKDENFALIVLHNRDSLTYVSNWQGKVLNDFAIANDEINLRMKDILTIINKWDRLDRLASNQEEKHTLRLAHINELINFSDTCSMILPAMYAAHAADFGFNKASVNSAMSRIEKRLGRHSYMNDYAFDDPYSDMFNLLPASAAVLMLIWIGLKLLRHGRQKQKTKRFNQLSIREKDIFNLIEAGKSNKEIANELNIEISTVKKHVNSIFGKLKVKSRNDINTYKSDNP